MAAGSPEGAWSAQRAQARAVRRRARAPGAVLDALDAVVWQLEPDGRLQVSAGAARLLGHDVEDFAAPGFWRALVHADDLATAQASMTGGPVATFRVRHRDGSLRWVENRSSPVDPPGSFVGVLVDRTAEIESERESVWLLRSQARQDDLTALPNRRAFIETIEQVLTESAEAQVALLFLDLDHFKEINDSLGHRIGDELLRRMAERISECASGMPVARLGGDEFAVLVPGAGEVDAACIGEELAAAVCSPLVVDGMTLRVRTSVGYAIYPDDADNAEELVRRADIAVFQAKGRETDTHRYDVGDDRFDSERVRLVGELDAAVTGGQLLLHHQLLFDVASGEAIGTESLVRWMHPELGSVRPDRFIELAEVSGQIKPVTRWVIKRALADLARIDGCLGAGRRLETSVNLSVRNLHEPDLVDWLADALSEAGLDGVRLVVEITESTIMEDHDSACELIGRLRALGVRTWIDDFGTGHSSLARLRTLPVDAVKIDRAFVIPSTQSTVDRQLLAGLIDIAHGLGLQTVAEGVEDAETFELLRTLGCDIAQGYHLARPTPIEQVIAALGHAPQAGGVPVQRGVTDHPESPAIPASGAIG